MAHQRTLVTAALPYANGPIHIGHLAGAYLPADLYCRYQRLQGEDLVFICGSDELGAAILMRAQAQGIDPRDIVDRYHPMIRDAFEAFGMSFDYYGRTTSDTHAATSQAFFRTLAEQGLFRLKTEAQLYDPEAGLFLADRFVRGTCPVCGFEDAYGDQCEQCGSTLSPSELINPRSALTDATPELRDTTHWYLPLGEAQPELEAWIGTRTGWKANVLGQIKSWFTDGLRDRSITRDVPWGVPVPTDVAEAAGVDAAGKVIYVWFDAPIGYISATKEWAARTGDPDRWQTYWQQEDTRLLHFIGKDNIVFHCIMFPAMLMQHGGFVLPENVPANEFLNIEGQKLSTSRGWAVWLHEYLETFPPDLLRYALATTLPEAKDADFSWADFQARVNSELADILGNFVNRTMTFATRFFDGHVPPLVDPSEADRAVLEQLAAFPDRIGASYEAFRFREAVFETMGLARLGNKYFNDTEPWHTRKTDPQACGNTVHVCLQLCAALGLLLEPVLPVTAERLRAMLRLTDVRSSLPGASGGRGWSDAGMSLLEAGHTLGTPSILFEKIDDEVIAEQMAKLGGAEEVEEVPEAPYEALRPEIVFDDFLKPDLRVGRVLVAEPVKKSKKLLRLEIDLGVERRQILSGVAQHMAPEDLVGTSVVVVANLAPRKMMGLESQGMVLFAEDRDGALRPVTTTGEPGAVVR
ncbi:MAG: methionine--tRNA ligase [Bacteroidota bacterium]